jgi:hypothetical protein
MNIGDYSDETMALAEECNRVIKVGMDCDVLEFARVIDPYLQGYSALLEAARSFISCPLSVTGCMGDHVAAAKSAYLNSKSVQPKEKEK